MIDSINSASLLRAQTVSTLDRASPSSSVASQTTIDAVAKSQQRTSAAVVPVKTFAVTQANNASSGSSPSAQLPRGSLVDFLV